MVNGQLIVILLNTNSLILAGYSQFAKKARFVFCGRLFVRLEKQNRDATGKASATPQPLTDSNWMRATFHGS